MGPESGNQHNIVRQRYLADFFVDVEEGTNKVYPQPMTSRSSSISLAPSTGCRGFKPC